MDIGDELVEAYPKLKRFAVSYVRDVDRAEDLVMSAITKILEMANSSDIVNLEAYAITVVKNLVRDEIKRNRPEYGEVPEVPDYADLGGLLVIKDALSSLSDKCQEILELSAVGYSYSEMAGMLGIAEGTVASRKSQCLNDFKKEWDGAHV